MNNDANTIFEYSYDNAAKTYCITATFQKVSYYVSNAVSNPTAGLCAGHTGGAPIADGIIIQTVTSSNCLTTRVRAVTPGITIRTGSRSWPTASAGC